MACQCQPPHAPRRGIGVRTRRRHLAAAALTALVVRRVSGYENRPSPACASRRATRKGVERAPGSGLLLPPCVVERRKERGGRGGPCRGVSRRGREASGLATARERASFRKKAGRCVKRTLSGGSPASLLALFLKIKQTVFRHCRKTVCARADALPVRGAKRPRWGSGAKPRAAGGGNYSNLR